MSPNVQMQRHFLSGSVLEQEVSHRNSLSNFGPGLDPSAHGQYASEWGVKMGNLL